MSGRILIADDDTSVRNTLRLALEDEGYEVETAANGKIAMRAHVRRPVDVLITDLFMPESDGFEIISSVREQSPGVRIVAISGWERSHNTDYLGAARIAGADVVLRKPFTMDELLGELRNLIPKNTAASKAPKS